jgi:hypothetical protein
LLVDAAIYDRFLQDQLQKEGGYLVPEKEKEKLLAAMWDSEGHRTVETVARPAAAIAEIAAIRTSRAMAYSMSVRGSIVE